MAKKYRRKKREIVVSSDGLFRCPILPTRHFTSTEVCLNRRSKLKLFQECVGCKIELPEVEE
jgi:hypothetical protein